MDGDYYSAIIALYAGRNYIDLVTKKGGSRLSHTENPLSDLIRDYIESRKVDRLEKFDKETEKALGALTAEEKAPYEQARYEKRVAEEASFKPHNWLDDAAQKAKQLQLVTHALKFAHSDAKGTSLFADFPSSEFSKDKPFISTATIEKPQIDVGGNAAALPIGKLLLLEVDGKALVNYILADDASPLAPFAQSPEQLQTWLEGLKAAVSAKDPSSHKFAKQLYWPTDGGYHLLLPLYATSLTQEVFDRVQVARFSEAQKAARQARRDKKPSEVPTVEFRDLAVQSFGGTKPQNISQLNSSRGGRSYLLSSAPPTWQTQLKPPLNVSSVFAGPFNYLANKQIYWLRKFLADNLHKRSVWKIRNERARRIDDIVDRLIGYAETVRVFEAGWSASPECRLPMHQKLWLDPKRRHNDKDFCDLFDQKEWQSQVAADFSRFLNSELEKNRDIATGDVEFIQWKVLTAQELRLVKEDVEGAYRG